MKTSHYLIPIAATVALLATSVAIAKPAFPSKVPYQGFSCATCHDGSPGLASLNSFANDFRAAGNTWTVALCEKDSDGDGASNGAELLDPDCDWAEGDAPRTGEAYKPADASDAPEVEEPTPEPMGGAASPTPMPEPSGGAMAEPGAPAAGGGAMLPTQPADPSAQSGVATPGSHGQSAAVPGAPAPSPQGGGAATDMMDSGGDSDSGGCSVFMARMMHSPLPVSRLRLLLRTRRRR